MGAGLRRREFLATAAPVMLAPLVAVRAATEPGLRLKRTRGTGGPADRLVLRSSAISERLDGLDVSLAHPTIPGLSPLLWSFERRPVPQLGGGVEVAVAPDRWGMATLRLSGVFDGRPFEQTLRVRAVAGGYALTTPDGQPALDLTLASAATTIT